MDWKKVCTAPRNIIIHDTVFLEKEKIPMYVFSYVYQSLEAQRMADTTWIILAISMGVFKAGPR